MPYSVEEIYGIRTSGRYGTLKQSYHEFYRIYGTDTYEDKVSPETIITEDSNSGYQFFEHVCIENGLKCESMNGKSNVFHYLNKHKGEKYLSLQMGRHLVPRLTGCCRLSMAEKCGLIFA